jgi:uncharacterized membrane-anchored protein
MSELTLTEEKEKVRLFKIFNILAFCNLTHKQEDLVMSFENQFKKTGRLSERQTEIIEDIYDRSNP